MSARHPVMLLSIALLIALGACSGATSPGSSAPTPADLDGRTFLSVAVAGATLVPGSEVRLTFDGSGIGLSAGCNSMGGEYAIEDGMLRVGAMMSTEMACDEPLMAQDQWLAAFLDGSTIALDGDTLTLASEGVTLTLEDRETADPDRPLVGTRWILDGLVARDAVSSVPVGVTSTLTFGQDRVDIEAGCNSGSGPVTIGDTAIDFGPIALTEMGCGPEAMAVEQAVTSVLQGAVDYSIEAGTLTLNAGGAGLIYRAQG